MDLLNGFDLAFIVNFVVPGFICLKFYELLSPGPESSNSSRIIEALTYSCIIYAIFIGPINHIESNDLYESNFVLYTLFYAFILLVSPVILAVLWLKLRACPFICRHLPHPAASAWDYVFSQRKQSWIIVTMSSGDTIAGLYSSQSFTTSYPSSQQIYLEEAWVLDDQLGFSHPQMRSDGVLICSSDILKVEFFKVDEEV